MTARLEDQIRAAFADASHPGDAGVVAPTYDDEGVGAAFAGKHDWAALSSEFLDQQAVALAFFSDDALCFYLPAYLLADLAGALRVADPAYHLTNGMRPLAKLSPAQVEAVSAYLSWKAERDEYAKPHIEEALLSFWWPRVQNSGREF